ncbi:MAG TPA: SLC13 family permease [Candidatus Hydrogenedens sp.]|nr:SLC13 family permease [Candidatus Hydrogenedens sp.]
MFEQKYIALILFCLAYFLFFVFPARRSVVACIASLFVILSGMMSVSETFWNINWNVMGIFVGMLFLADLFIESRCPAFLATYLIRGKISTSVALLIICALTSFISAFVENVATVLIIAPICLELTKRLKIDPREIIIAVAISSNLQGTATLIGDPPSMLLAGYANFNFMDFFFHQGKPGVFFAIQVGAITSLTYLYFVFRKYKSEEEVPLEPIKTWVPTFFLIFLIISLALSSFFEETLFTSAGFICMVIALVGLTWAKLSHNISIVKSTKKLDWDTTIFLTGVFILVSTLNKFGWTNDIAEAIHAYIGDSRVTIYIALIIISIILSGFIDNVPYLAAMLPVTTILAEKGGGDPTLFYFGLLMGSCLGGNMTPIGASANIVGTGLLKKAGYPVSFLQWTKIAAPFTFIAVVPASIFALLIWL